MKILLATVAVLGFATAAQAQTEYAQIIQVQPNYHTVYQNIPTTSCQNVEVPIYGRTQGQASTGDTLFGALIGGALGNQVGGGKGKDAATVLGAIIGADVANKRSGSQQYITGYRVQQQCYQSVDRQQSTVIKNYTITYDWNGITARSFTNNQYNVGDQIPVSVSINANQGTKMNDDDFNKKFDGMSFSTSWTQQTYNVHPYNSWSVTQPSAQEVANAVGNELARLDSLEDEIQAMTSYPDAERLLANILK